MGSLRDFQWALFSKLQEIERKDGEISELRRTAVIRERQLEAMRKEVRILRGNAVAAAMAPLRVIPLETSVIPTSGILPGTESSVTVGASIVVPRKKNAKRVAISAEPIGQFAAATVQAHFPKSDMYVLILRNEN
ncbi:hypothetical protein BV898_07169 [Hypsibius exemplaris]|uniref:Uncharacterized protein n=1 Tax=Hypsibius exemplaris TaxID=2072580 RepID=A0A1W0WU68_HYPEX|nr:hypothetical protein BV898_07169 [Hypsibius exemplaris]